MRTIVEVDLIPLECAQKSKKNCFGSVHWKALINQVDAKSQWNQLKLKKYTSMQIVFVFNSWWLVQRRRHCVSGTLRSTDGRVEAGGTHV